MLRFPFQPLNWVCWAVLLTSPCWFTTTTRVVEAQPPALAVQETDPAPAQIAEQTTVAEIASLRAAAFAGAQALGAGVNLGNGLDAPNEGEWGYRIEPEHLTAIAKAGFRHVRLPVKWSAHALAEAPYTIEPEFFERVDEVISLCLEAQLHVVLNVHHYDEIHKDPVAHRERLAGLWRQIASRYQDQPHSVLFEVLNEPAFEFTAESWNEVFLASLAEIRSTNPNRLVIVGPVQWNNFRALAELKLPAADPSLIGTFHYYDPFPFTHQGAPWVTEPKLPTGVTWTSSKEELQQLEADFSKASEWAAAAQRPLYLGEFGAYSAGELTARARWTADVRAAAERHHFAWCYWEFGSGFGVYDPAQSTWREPLLNALTAP